MTNLSGANLNNGAAVAPQGEGMDSPSIFPEYPAYRDSGVDWLGSLPSHWSKTKIGRISQSGMGQTILKEMLEDVPSSISLPVYSASEGYDAFGYFPTPSVRLKAGDLVVGARGSIGKTRLIVEDSTCTQTTIWVRPSKELISSYYLYWVFVGGRESLFPFDKTAIPMLTIDQLKQGWLGLPSTFEQIQIARFLDHETARIDALIEEQQRLIELLKEKRQAVISHAVTKGLDSTVPMKDSGVEWLGEVPAHWEVIALKRLARKITDGEHISPQFTDEGMPFLSAKNIRDRVVEYNVEKYVSLEDGLRFRRRCNPEVNDVLIVSRGATIGRVGLVEQEVIFCLLGRAVAGAECNTVIELTLGHHAA